MADLSKIQTAEPIEVTDGVSKAASIATTNPASNASGLVIREANRGQNLSANSKSVVLASDVVEGTIWKTDGLYYTYSAAYAGLTLDMASSQNAFACLSGSSTMLVKITRFVITWKNQTETSVDLKIEKYSTLATGGSPTTLTAVPHNSTNPAATGTALVYTTQPTFGADVGGMRNWKVNVPPSPDSTEVDLEFYYAANTRLCWLNNANENLVILWYINPGNLATPLTLPNIDIWMEWTEQAP